MEVKTKNLRKTSAKKPATEKKLPVKKETPKPEIKKSPVKKPAKKPAKPKQMEMNLNSFNIMKLRMEKGISAKKLAEMAGVSDAAIRDIEKGVSDPKFSTVQKIMWALGYKVKFELK
jgi:ribosome-binding protein aMBF1 (putative translation factor)